MYEGLVEIEPHRIDWKNWAIYLLETLKKNHWKMPRGMCSNVHYRSRRNEFCKYKLPPKSYNELTWLSMKMQIKNYEQSALLFSLIRYGSTSTLFISFWDGVFRTDDKNWYLPFSSDLPWGLCQSCKPIENYIFFANKQSNMMPWNQAQ